MSVTKTLQGKTVQEPFRRSLGQAVQWFDMLQVEIEHHLEDALANAHTKLNEA